MTEATFSTNICASRIALINTYKPLGNVHRRSIAQDTVHYFITNPHMRGYGRRSSESPESPNVCMYHTNDGKRCAVGRFMSDEEIEKYGEVNTNALDLIRSTSGLALIRPEDRSFWLTLQSWHDSIENWMNRVPNASSMTPIPFVTLRGLAIAYGIMRGVRTSFDMYLSAKTQKVSDQLIISPYLATKVSLEAIYNAGKTVCGISPVAQMAADRASESVAKVDQEYQDY